MIKAGSKLIAKPEFLINMGLSYDKRELTLTKFDSHGSGYFIEVSADGKEAYMGHVSYGWLSDNFYLIENINYEVLKFLESTEIKSFNALTVDGKVINIELM